MNLSFCGAASTAYFQIVKSNFPGATKSWRYSLENLATFLLYIDHHNTVSTAELSTEQDLDIPWCFSVCHGWVPHAGESVMLALPP